MSRRAWIVFLLVAAMLLGGSARHVWAAPEASVASESVLVLTRQPLFFDVAAPQVSVRALVASIGESPKAVTKLRVSFGGTAVEQTGKWEPARLNSSYQSTQSFLDDWAAYQAPGSASGENRTGADRIARALETASKAAVPFGVLSQPVRVSVQPKPGEKFPIVVEATLEDGRVLSATGTAIATAFSTPAGWVIGDCHVHTTYSDGQYTPADIRLEALALGHHFTAITDHINLVRTKTDQFHTETGWSLYKHILLNHLSAVSGYAMLPNFEVTAKSGTSISGDLLGIGYWDTDPTAIQNQVYNATYLASLIQGPNPDTSPCLASVAHPTGAPAFTEPLGGGYHGVQIDNSGAEAFWRNSMPYTSCHPVAINGSDAHYAGGFILPMDGRATWVLAPSFNSYTQFSSKIQHLTTKITNGLSVATSAGSLGYFTVNGNMADQQLSLTTGTYPTVRLGLYPIQNGYSTVVSLSPPDVN